MTPAIKIRPWQINVRLYSGPLYEQKLEHEDTWEASAVHPGAAADRAFSMSKSEVRRNKKKLNKVTRVIFSVTPKDLKEEA